MKQLEDYAGQWRNEPSMTPIARRLSDQDRLAVASYYEMLVGPSPSIRAPSPAGEALYLRGDSVRGLEPCASCHADGGEDQGLATPRLAGQTADYVRDQLTAFKDSRRRNDPRDVMGGIARKLHPDEIDQLASHIATLP